jgi:hypothetical protein
VLTGSLQHSRFDVTRIQLVSAFGKLSGLHMNTLANEKSSHGRSSHTSCNAAGEPKDL